MCSWAHVGTRCHAGRQTWAVPGGVPLPENHFSEPKWLKFIVISLELSSYTLKMSLVNVDYFIGFPQLIWWFNLLLDEEWLRYIRSSLVAQTVESTCNAGYPGSIFGSGRSPGESHGQRSLAGYSPWGRTDETRLSDWYTDWKCHCKLMGFVFFFFPKKSLLFNVYLWIFKYWNNCMTVQWHWT